MSDVHVNGDGTMHWCPACDAAEAERDRLTKEIGRLREALERIPRKHPREGWATLIPLRADADE